MTGRRREAIAKMGRRATVCALLFAAAPARADCDGPREEVFITGVTENFEVNLDDGRIIRLAGLDLPSPARADPATLAKVSADFVALTKDGVASFTPLSPKADRWGRWPGNVFAVDAPGDSFALRLLAAGDARQRPEFETRGCVAERQRAEGTAIAAGLGVWADPDYGQLDGIDADALKGADGRFIVVEGLVRQVGVGRSRLYLDFGSRRMLSATATKKEETAFLRAGVKLRDLKGARVRLRGVLDLRYAPRIALTEAGSLQVLGDGGARP